MADRGRETLRCQNMTVVPNCEYWWCVQVIIKAITLKGLLNMDYMPTMGAQFQTEVSKVM